ncbi:MAG: tRNA (adenosine(37)-N6)-dimethylallyltransferase MiaA [Gammaproteobacteria bacterium]
MTTSSPIICLLGPTATGKTDVAIALSHYFPCEIISVDSAMIYKTMDIGTAKPSTAQLNLVPHHLIDIRDPAENYSAADFCTDVHNLILQIQQRQRIPLLVGGTMLYFHALQNGLATMPSADPAIRQRIEVQALQQGWASLHQQLHQIDPLSAQRIHPNDKQRIQRALEVYYLTGHPLSTWQQQTTPQLLPNFINIALQLDSRHELHTRIATRFDDMLQQGFLEEVERLRQRGDLHLSLPSMRAVGYRQAWQYLAGQFDYEMMREKSIIATRQLAKRQITWLRNSIAAQHFNSNSPQLLSEILSNLPKLC